MYGKLVLLKLSFYILVSESLFLGILWKINKIKLKTLLPYVLIICIKLFLVLGFVFYDAKFPPDIPLVFDLGLMWSLGFLFSLPLLLVYLTIFLIQTKRVHKTKTNTIPSDNNQELISRKALFHKGTSLLTTSLKYSPILGTTGFVSGMLLGSREIVVENIPIGLKNLGREFHGYKIMQLSDIHIGPSLPAQQMLFCIDRIKNHKADLLVVTGDILDFSLLYIQDVVHFFKAIKPYFSDGIYCVLGNHDFFDDHKVFLNHMQQTGITFLRNQTITIQKGSSIINLLGMDYAWPYHGIYGERMKLAQKLFAQTQNNIVSDGPNILLNHDPADFIWLQKKSIDLVLSGHTHGGHIKLSSSNKSIVNPVSWVYPYYSGYYEEKGSKLYVNRGLSHTLPIRVGAPPEITILELRKV
ncbi:MAG: metallophosphoesterase [Spirochaetota bacterium]